RARTRSPASGPGAPDPVGTASSLWVNLTTAITTPRATLNGQLNAPPNTPGPNDDFRMSFPQNKATWSDLALTYIDTSNPTTGTSPTPGIPNTPGQGPAVPVLYAALGIGTGNDSNAVFRTEAPNLAPADAVATTWYVGDPGVPQDEI